MKKAIVTDLDGTLFNEKSKISPYTADILRKATEQGYKIIIASGRHHADVNYIIQDFLKIPAYGISANGSSVISPEGEMVIKHRMREDLVKKLVTLEVPKDVYIHLYKGEKWFCNSYDEGSVVHQAMSGFMFEVVDYNDFNDFSDCSKICFIARSEEGIKYMERTVNQMKDPDLSFFFTMARCFEAMDIKADKALALSAVLQKEGISKGNVFAFGDGMNDKEMLSLAGNGFVMNNAVSGLKDALPKCKIIGNNCDDAVGHFIEDNILYPAHSIA